MEGEFMKRTLLCFPLTNLSCNIFVFHKIVNLFKVTPEIDLFASELNHQVPKYISWNPDQETFAIDSSSISWANIKFYAFPPLV